MRKEASWIAAALACFSASTWAANPLLGEIEIVAATKLERDAGVWVDGQYVGFVKDLRGTGKLVLVPGERQLQFKLVGYQEVERTIVVEPGRAVRYRIAMNEAPDLTYPDKASTAQVRLAVEPAEAAVFVNGNYVGHVDRFDGRQGMRLSPGTYRFTIALPGYHSFETELTLRVAQTYEIKTTLLAGSIEEQAELLTAITVAPRAPDAP
jgi:hypothetical protein